MAVLSGGDKLEKFLQETAKKVSNPGVLRVGFLEESTYTNGVSVPLVAATQNFGAPSRGIPPRPFFTNMVRDKSPGWAGKLARILEANDYDATKSLEVMGTGIKAQLQTAIIETTAPPLSPVTLMVRQIKAEQGRVNDRSTWADVVEARRRIADGQTASGVSTKPLIETSNMINSVDYEVTTE